MAFIILIAVVSTLAYRATSPEERKRLLAVATDVLWRLKAAATKPRPEYEVFREALAARAPRVLVTPVIVVLFTAVLVGMLFGATAIADPDTLVAWGASIGPRTTNGEWWRLVTSTFVHAGTLHLLMDVAIFIQLGVILERLVGRLTFAAVYLSAGVFERLVDLSAQPVAVISGASGAVFGLYGLLLASLIWQTFHDWRGTRAPDAEEHAEPELRIPRIAMKRVGLGAALFIIYGALSGVAYAAGEFAGLLVGLTYGIVLARRVRERTPKTRDLACVVVATVLIAVAGAIGLRNIADVKPEIVRVLGTEKSTVAAYQAGFDAFRKGRTTAEALAQLAERTIVSELQAVDARLEALKNVPPEHRRVVADAREYLRLRCASWHARSTAIRRTYAEPPRKPEGTKDGTWRLQMQARFKSDTAARGLAEGAERASMEALQRIAMFDRRTAEPIEPAVARNKP